MTVEASRRPTSSPELSPGTGTAAGLAPRILAGLAALVPLAIAASYVARIATDVPFYDEWRFIPFIEKWRAGALTWADVVAQHDGHRIVTTRLAILASARLTHWNILYEVWGGFAFLVGTGAILAWLHGRATRSSGAGWSVASAFALATIVFGLRQWENLYAPWGLCIFSLGFFALLTFVLVQRRRWGAAMATATLASLSFTNGILVWPIVLLQLLVEEYRVAPSGAEAARRAARPAAAWVAVGAAVLAAYFSRYDRGLAHPSGSAGVIGLRFLAAIGTSISPDRGVVSGGAPLSPLTGAPLSIALGVFTLAALALALRPRPRRELPADYGLHLAMALFSLGSVAMLALGRSYLGLLQALSSRYTTSVTLLLAAVLLASARPARPGGWLAAARWGLVALAICGNVIATRKELQIVRHQAAGLREWARRVRNYRSTTDGEFANPHYPPEQVRRWSAALEREGLSLFHRPPGARP